MGGAAGDLKKQPQLAGVLTCPIIKELEVPTFWLYSAQFVPCSLLHSNLASNRRSKQRSQDPSW